MRLTGLTSRPRPPTRGDSPYSLRSAARLTLALAGQLGLKRVVFVGHADGALVALLATALAAGVLFVRAPFGALFVPNAERVWYSVLQRAFDVRDRASSLCLGIDIISYIIIS